MKKLNYVLLLALALCFILISCSSTQNQKSQEENIFSEVKFVKLPKMKIAMYTAISLNPEDDAINFMNNWARENGILDVKDYTPRNFGWDYPQLTREQKAKNLRGYGYCYTIPKDFIPKSEGAEITNIEEREYAVMRITDPFKDAFVAIPKGWVKLDNYVQNIAFRKPYKTDYFMEEIIQINGVTYMDIYFPVE